MLDENTFGIEQPPAATGPQAWMRRNRPAILAAAWLWLVFLALALVTLFTGWASLPVTFTLQSLVSLGAGALAAWLLEKEQRAEPHYTRMGATAGFYLALTTAVVVTLVGIWAGLGSLGTLIPFMVPYCISLPLEVGICGFTGAVGARLMQAILVKRLGEPQKD